MYSQNMTADVQSIIVATVWHELCVHFTKKKKFLVFLGLVRQQNLYERKGLKTHE